MSETNSFFLRLANGQSWQLLSEPTTKVLVERLGALMKLSPDGPEDSIKLIIAVGESEQSGSAPERLPERLLGLIPEIPEFGWVIGSTRQIGLMTHPDFRGIICLLRPNCAAMDNLANTWVLFHPIFDKVRKAGGLVAHAGLLTCGNDAILLVAPSGMGKSTCSRRIGHPWFALCDDQALVVRTEDGGFRCHPLPTWSQLWGNLQHKSWDVQRHLPLKAIFFMERASANSVYPVGKGKAASLLTKCAESMAATHADYMNREEKINVRRILFDNASVLVSSVPCFALRANLTTRYWEDMESVL